MMQQRVDAALGAPGASPHLGTPSRAATHRARGLFTPTQLGEQLQLAVESLVLATTVMQQAEEEDDDDPTLRELRERWTLERNRLLEQHARVDALAREYAQRRGARARERETERRSRTTAAERQVRELQEEVRHYRSLHASPSTTPLGSARGPGDAHSPAATHRCAPQPSSAPSTERASLGRAAALAPLGGTPAAGSSPAQPRVASATAFPAVGSPAAAGGGGGLRRSPSAGREMSREPHMARGASGKAGELRRSPSAGREMSREPHMARGASGKAGELRQLRRQLQQLHADSISYASDGAAPLDGGGGGSGGGGGGGGGGGTTLSGGGGGLAYVERDSGAEPESARARRRSSSRLAAAGGAAAAAAHAEAALAAAAPALRAGPPRLVQRPGRAHGAAVSAVCLTEHASCVVSASGDGFLQLWELRRVAAHARASAGGSGGGGGDGAADGGGSGGGGEASSVWVATQRISCRAGNVNSVVYAARAHTLVAGCEDGSLRLYRLAERARDGAGAEGAEGADEGEPRFCLYSLRSLRGHTEEVMTVGALSWLASGSQDSSIKLWDLATGECTQTLAGHTSWVMALAIRYADGSASPASGAPCYLLSASGDGTARLWIDSGSAATGGEGAPPQFKLKAVLRGHERALLAAELLTAHGLAATGSDDCTIRLWSLASHECVTLLPHQRSPVCALAWHGRRRQLLSACEDRTLRVWELASDGRGATASCVGLVPAAADDDGAESDDALPSYALAICPAPNGFDLICGLDDGSLVVLL